MSFITVIPARIASTRLPNKPLADLGGKPMIVRVAEQAKQSGSRQVIVATDHADIIAACQFHGIEARITRNDHPSGTDRIAEIVATLDLPVDAVVVNVQGDEPLIDPELISATAAQVSLEAPMATAAHPITDAAELFNPNAVKVVLNKRNQALYFSRAAIPWHRDEFAASQKNIPSSMLGERMPLRHIGIYAYRNDFLQAYPTLAASPLEHIEALEQLRALWHGFPIAVHVTRNAPYAGVDTPEDLERVQRYFLDALTTHR